MHGTGKASFEDMLRTQARRLLPWLDRMDRSHVKYVARPALLEHSGMSDNELQKLIHDGNMPRHSLRIDRQKAYEVEPMLKMLARYTNSYEYLIKE